MAKKYLTGIITNALEVLGKATGAVTVVIQAVLNQTADLFQLKNGLGGVIVQVEPGGRILAWGGLELRGNNFGQVVGISSEGNPDVICLVLRPSSVATVDTQRWLTPSGAVALRATKNGYLAIAKVAAPADAEITTSEAQLWWDVSTTSSQLVVKGKNSSGVAISYSPGHLLAITKYTANGTSAARSTSTATGITISFIMPTLQTGQRVKIEVQAHYYLFASALTTGLAINNHLMHGAVILASKWAPSNASTFQTFPNIAAYIDNTQIAAGTSVTINLNSSSGSATAYAYVAPAHIAASIV